jgi:hypothetical protein
MTEKEQVVMSGSSREYESKSSNKPKLSENISKALTQYDDMSKELSNIRRDFITVFGVFASFVTFLSVEIQIFKTINSFWLLIGLSSFLMSGILSFSFALSSFGKGKNEWKELNSPFTLLIFVFVIIAIFGFFEHSRLVASLNVPYV